MDNERGCIGGIFGGSQIIWIIIIIVILMLLSPGFFGGFGYDK